MSRSIVSSAARADALARRTALSPYLPYPTSAPPSQRLLSIDAMRGFVMFWLVGGREVVMALTGCVSLGAEDWLQRQLSHPYWEGFRAWDMVGPLFLFVVGVAMPFAIGKRYEQGEGRRAAYVRILRRVALLWILGMIAQGSLLKWHLHQLEFYSNTLQAIAVGYLVTAVALMHLPLTGQIGLFAALTVGYSSLLLFVPFAGHAAGTLEANVNLARYVDEAVLGHFRRDHNFTWVLSSMGFCATVLLGALAGRLLRARLPAARKLTALIAIGLACAAVGWTWSYWLPLNRHIWTGSLILWAGGLSCLMLAAFYAVIDLGGVKRWSFPLVVIGANALLAYVFDEVYGRTLSDALVGNLASRWPVPYDELLTSVAGLGLLWLILWHLYRTRTFLRA